MTTRGSIRLLARAIMCYFEATMSCDVRLKSPVLYHQISWRRVNFASGMSNDNVKSRPPSISPLQVNSLHIGQGIYHQDTKTQRKLGVFVTSW